MQTLFCLIFYHFKINRATVENLESIQASTGVNQNHLLGMGWSSVREHLPGTPKAPSSVPSITE